MRPVLTDEGMLRAAKSFFVNDPGFDNDPPSIGCNCGNAEWEVLIDECLLVCRSCGGKVDLEEVEDVAIESWYCFCCDCKGHVTGESKTPDEFGVQVADQVDVCPECGGWSKRYRQYFE